ncbi:MAG: hypothetical protein ACRDTA_30710 [Pseudonocardiaceae bacterium]
MARYRSFEEMFDHEAVTSVNPTAIREDQLRNIRRSTLPTGKLGVVVFGIELLDPPQEPAG